MIELYDFQQEDVDKLADSPIALIGNEMGTGKTYEALARDKIFRQDGTYAFKTLVVAPRTVLPVWTEHCKIFNLTCSQVDPKARKASFEEFKMSDRQVFLVHWEALRLMPELHSIHWDHVIADECHRMQNRAAQQTRALKAIAAKRKTAMSGTPTTGYPDKFWSCLNWLDKKKFSSYWTYYKNFVDFEIILPQGYHKIKGPKNEDKLLAMIDPFYVRRLKKDVLKDLPDKTYQDVWVELDPKQRRAYQDMKKEMIAWVNHQEDTALVAPAVIAQLVRLQQFAVAYAEVVDGQVRLTEPSSKLDACMEILEDNPTEQFVIFSNFKQLVSLLEARLKKAGISYGLLTGDVPDEDRARNVARFQAGQTRVFIGTTQAGGVGITLHAASRVIFLDRNWSPALNQQAEDRLHRIGQLESVQVIDIMARSTVDLGRRQKLELKWGWIRQLLGDK